MNDQTYAQWKIQCNFRGFCRSVLKNEALNAYKEISRKQKNEVSLSDLAEENLKELSTYDKYFENEKAENSFLVAGREITEEMLTEALFNLSKEKLDVILMYYFLNMTDVEISKIYNITKSAVHQRRKSAFKQMKKFLEEKTNGESY